jgi:Holliday junction resolvase
MGGGSVSNYSERKLQEALHQARFYTQKAPSSGHGILDPETEEYIDQADIVAIRADPEISQYEGHISQVLVIEDKHEKPPQVYIEDHEKQQLERIEQITGGTAYFAVKWKHQQGDHQFFHIQDLIDTGQHWKITEETSGMVLNDIV